MLDTELINELKASLPELDLQAPLDVASPSLSASMHTYLEFYGFYETLKAFQLDYYWGAKSCLCGSSRQRVSTHYWKLQDAKGVVLLVHGLFDHVGIFQKITAHFLGLGYSVIALDLPGHGLSEGGATYIRSFSDYGDVVADLIQFFAAEIQDKPLYGVGQSTGAAVLMSLSFDFQRRDTPQPFERMVFLGPLIRPQKWLLGRWAYRLFGRFLTHIHRDLSSANSHDSEFHNFLRYHDGLQPRKLCISWIGALHQWVENFSAQPILDVPILIIQGTGDGVVDWRFNVRVISEHFPNHQVNYVEGAMHHLANEGEPWRQAIYNGIGPFFRQKKIGPPQANQNRR